DIGDALSHYRLAVSFNGLGRKHEAVECCRTALILGLGSQGDLMTQGLLTLMERELCRWERADAELAIMREMAARLPADASMWTNVFAHTTLTEDAEEHLRVARSCARFEALGVDPLPSVPRHDLDGRLRVGFVSADLHQHATAHLMAE